MLGENFFNKKTENFVNTHPNEVKRIIHEYESHPEILKPIITISELEKECDGDEMLEKLLSNTIDYFYRYTESVCEYEALLTEDITDSEINTKLKQWENSRKIIHNATIDSINILARNMYKSGKNTDWAKGIPKESRVSYGNLALQNTYLQLLKYKNKEEEKK